MSTTLNLKVTGYGYLDNSPPGAEIAYPDSLHQTAGGTGTFANPITFAADPSQFAPGTEIYIPALQKYFIMEDYCAAAVQQGGGIVDIWVGGSANSNAAQLNAAESAITQTSEQVIVNPASNLPVNTTSLFTDTTTTVGTTGTSGSSGSSGTSGTSSHHHHHWNFG
jgi:3D (Asp-Asp-Asp) domain-containing protein